VAVGVECDARPTEFATQLDAFYGGLDSISRKVLEDFFDQFQIASSLIWRGEIDSRVIRLAASAPLAK
jgi:hypothetical protein